MTDGALIGLVAAAPIAGASAGQLARAAREGKLPGVVRRGGRWKLTAADAAAYREAKRGPGRPASAGLEIEHPSTFPHRPEWRARIGDGEWSVSDTRERAIRAAHAADRKRRLIEAQRRELARWHGAPRRPTVAAEAPLLAPGRRVVVVRRGRGLRAVVLDVSSSGRVLVGWMDGGSLHTGVRSAAELREEIR